MIIKKPTINYVQIENETPFILIDNTPDAMQAYTMSSSYWGGDKTAIDALANTYKLLVIVVSKINDQEFQIKQI